MPGTDASEVPRSSLALQNTKLNKKANPTTTQVNQPLPRLLRAVYLCPKTPASSSCSSFPVPSLPFKDLETSGLQLPRAPFHSQVFKTLGGADFVDFVGIEP